MYVILSGYRVHPVGSAFNNCRYVYLFLMLHCWKQPRPNISAALRAYLFGITTFRFVIVQWSLRWGDADLIDRQNSLWLTVPFLFGMTVFRLVLCTVVTTMRWWSVRPAELFIAYSNTRPTLVYSFAPIVFLLSRNQDCQPIVVIGLHPTTGDTPVWPLPLGPGGLGISIEITWFWNISILSKLIYIAFFFLYRHF